jgi:hypothetical protein
VPRWDWLTSWLVGWLAGWVVGVGAVTVGLDEVLPRWIWIRWGADVIHWVAHRQHDVISKRLKKMGVLAFERASSPARQLVTLLVFVDRGLCMQMRVCWLTGPASA